MTSPNTEEYNEILKEFKGLHEWKFLFVQYEHIMARSSAVGSLESTFHNKFMYFVNHKMLTYQLTSLNVMFLIFIYISELL